MIRHAPAILRAATVAALFAMSGLAPLHAQETATDAVETPAAPKEPLPLWELGLVGIAAYQPAYPGSDQDLARVRVLPFGIYRGSLLRADGNGIGLRGFRTKRVEWDVSGSGSFGSSANRVHVRDGMPSIGTLVEIGPALKVNLGDLVDDKREARLTQLELPVRAVFDVSHHFEHRGWTFEPRLSHTAWTGQTFALVVSASALFGDRSLNRLYYGVDTPYATADRPAYDAHAGLVATRLNASLRHRINSSAAAAVFRAGGDRARRRQRGQPAGAQQAGRGLRHQPDLGRLALSRIRQRVTPPPRARQVVAAGATVGHTIAAGAPRPAHAATQHESSSSSVADAADDAETGRLRREPRRPIKPNETSPCPTWLLSLDRFFPIRYLAWITCAVVMLLGAFTQVVAGTPAPCGRVLGLVGVLTGLRDVRQRRHSILRNYPVIGHLRFLFEFIRPEMRQYFIEGDNEAAPFSRQQRSLVYQRAKGDPDKRPLGTQLDVQAEGYEWINHSLQPTRHRRRTTSASRIGADLRAALRGQHLQHQRDELRRAERCGDPRVERRREASATSRTTPARARSACTTARRAAT